MGKKEFGKSTLVIPEKIKFYGREMDDKLQAESPVNSNSAFQVMYTTLDHHTLGIASRDALPNWWTEIELGQQHPLGIECHICQ